jgi:hypothetical protein
VKERQDGVVDADHGPCPACWRRRSTFHCYQTLFHLGNPSRLSLQCVTRIPLRLIPDKQKSTGSMNQPPFGWAFSASRRDELISGLVLEGPG